MEIDMRNLNGLGGCNCRGTSGLGAGDFTRSPTFIVIMGFTVLGIGLYFSRAKA